MNSSPQQIRSALLLYAVILLFIIAGIIARQQYDEKNALKEQLQLLENSFQQQRERNQLQLDSLQQSIQFREVVNLQLKDSLRLLEKKRKQLNQRSDENNAVIARIRDVDSLRNAVARHYR